MTAWFKSLFEISPKLKVALAVMWDLASLIVAILLAYLIRVGFDAWSFGKTEWTLVAATLLFTMSSLLLVGHYRQVIRHIGLSAIYLIATSLLLAVGYLYGGRYALDAFVPNTVPALFWGIAFLLITFPRVLMQASAQAQQYRNREKCIIFGASEAGRSLAVSLREGNDMVPVAFIDDKKIYHGKEISGIPVGTRNDIALLIEKHDVTKMLFAVNNTSITRRKELLTSLEPYAIELLSVPNIQDVASGKCKINELREIKIEELLGREAVPPIPELLHGNIRGKRVLVTGAGGSIGSELCRQIVKSEPESLVLFELSEFNLYQIENELKRAFPELPLIPVLASIQDIEAVREAIKHYNIQTIYHAAAYKHVPMVEANPLIGVRNNVFGTANVAQTAAEFDVEKFVLVSTDKAVRPTNIMGATKRFAELFVQGIAELDSNTEFAIVRFGNVLGSSGSVVPLFKKQIEAGGPITVTHPDIIRYFMTIPEAAQLVIQAGSLGTKGEVFVLDMGEPVRIVDLAKKMAHLMGHSIRSNTNPDGDIEMKYSGLRPGEKLYEELLIDDADTTTLHPRIMGADETKLSFDEVVMLLDELNYELIKLDKDATKGILRSAPLAYTPSVH